MTPARPGLALLLLGAFVTSIGLANAATSHYGGPDHMISVGLGLQATAGTLFAGACLALRDALQDAGGRAIVLAGIAAGAVVSLVTASPGLAIASGVAFLVSEVGDAAIYTPIRDRASFGDRRWAAAVTLSGLVGSVIDTVLFLWLAGFPIWSQVPGQMVGKTYATLALLAAALTLQQVVKRRALLRNTGKRARA
jgi:uncharacterized PurR-regulated membrane protein YhhQ (DUF165 family)